MSNSHGKNSAGWRLIIIVVVIVAAFLLAFMVPPIAQDPAYHFFADTRSLAGIPNFWDVLSNLPFLAIGLWGVWVASSAPSSIRIMHLVFAAGLVLICFGSAWYHLDPTNESLFWDRLPMTISFMACFAFALGEVTSRKVGRVSLLPLLLAGGGSVLYWHMTESAGWGDLRWYALVQFLPGILLIMFLLFYPQRYRERRNLWLAVAAYALAKVLEWQDAAIFDSAFPFSGHTLKHLAAAAGGYYVLRATLGAYPETDLPESSLRQVQ